MKITASAPGKLILLGEHSVVYGYPALATAINLSTTVKISTENVCPISKTRLISVDLATFNKSDIRINFYEDKYYYESIVDNKQKFDSCSKNAVIAITYLLNKLKINNLLGLKIVVSSNIPAGCGLGSSAAFSVALSAALMQVSGNFKLSIFELANEVESIFHESPSGIDVYVSQFGGLVEFRKIQQGETTSHSSGDGNAKSSRPDINLGQSSSSPVREPKNKISKSAGVPGSTSSSGDAKNSSTKNNFLSISSSGSLALNRPNLLTPPTNSDAGMVGTAVGGSQRSTTSKNLVGNSGLLVVASQLSTNSYTNSAVLGSEASSKNKKLSKKFHAEQIQVKKEFLEDKLNIAIVNTNVSRCTKSIVGKVRRAHNENPDFVASCCQAITHLVEQFKHELSLSKDPHWYQSLTGTAGTVTTGPTSSESTTGQTSDSLKSDGLTAPLSPTLVSLNSSIRSNQSTNGHSNFSSNKKASQLEALGRQTQPQTNTCSLSRILERNHHLLNSLGCGHPSIDKIFSLAKYKYQTTLKITGAGGGGCLFSIEELNKDLIFELESEGFTDFGWVVLLECLDLFIMKIEKNLSVLQAFLRTHFKSSLNL